MILNGTADAINKRSRQLNIPISSYLLIQAPAFSLTILIIALLFAGLKVRLVDILVSLAAAVFSFAAFTMMLHSLTQGYASINYAIFRLSFVFSSLAAVIIFGEVVTVSKCLGVLLAIGAIIFFFYYPGHTQVLRKASSMAFWAMLLGACFHLILKFATTINTSVPTFLFLASIFFGLMVVIYSLLNHSFTVPRRAIFYASLNGILMSLGTFGLLLALAKGAVSTVTPIVQLSFLITAVLSAAFLKEKLNRFQVIGLGCAAVAIILLGCL